MALPVPVNSPPSQADYDVLVAYTNGLQTQLTASLENAQSLQSQLTAANQAAADAAAAAQAAADVAAQQYANLNASLAKVQGDFDTSLQGVAALKALGVADIPAAVLKITDLQAQLVSAVNDRPDVRALKAQQAVDLKAFTDAQAAALAQVVAKS